MSDLTTAIRSIESAETLDLRHRILRPNQTLEDCAYPLDDAADTLHLGCIMAGDLVGIASLFHEPQPGEDNPHAWRIRGMAVLDSARNLGIGGRLLSGLLNHLRKTDREAEVWCNGRTSVQGFYERYGFRQQGAVFDLPPIGPHVVLIRGVEAT